MLRPLKLITFSKQLKKVIWSFLGALTKIVDIFLFFFVISLIMATIGVQIFEEIPVTDELKKGVYSLNIKSSSRTIPILSN